MRFRLPRSRRLVAAAFALAVCLGSVTVTAAASDKASSSDERMPAGFGEHKTRVAGIGINYVIGGHGPTLVLIHGYPQTWYEWHGIMPALAEHYTVIAPDLPGAGQSDAPASGYDKKTMAARLHALLVSLGKDHDVNVVGHDIGTMVAYSYAAQYPQSVRKLVLSEAPIPDPGIYEFPALTAQGPGVWNFGFFSLRTGLPESLIQGRELTWTTGFMRGIAVQKDALDPDDLQIFASQLRDEARLAASLAWFRTFPQDIADNARFRKKPLRMPVLAIGADGSLGSSVAKQVRHYATHVTPAVVPDSGHWIYEEQPKVTTDLLLRFLGGRR
ncbi:pimeloyl-ACP methyl ester carboxylesterase [Streptomyces sp. SAI-208]|uniref:alpha/beta fold hydrolase n=1 Tax=unclassified Streptomyces TaxID=2593676 RepID=UPI0024731F7D|nr:MULTISPECIES: alpha/beta hydrolase [unclassified Streptomyces]MDH6521457.1 pimeloyl-ACP methyl ester carboxylesterase [Streptomyces sp. SAI-090]MDH6612468.1 pimeloyl-ACP methyl ester carboxylesterase [Streptomyces sp. SAI-208]MDH6614446.1 pimeloyl-ACP methyl ester carboxylesterase [Streptomyces sp. SAI-135]